MKKLAVLVLVSCIAQVSHASTIEQIVGKRKFHQAFPIVSNHVAANILVDEADHKGVLRAANDLQADIERVTSVKPTVNGRDIVHTIIIGTIGHSRIIDELIHKGTISVAGISGKWESTLIEVVDNPAPGIAQALVIAGSDKRGTIFGIYEISSQIGISPWYYWADVPVKKSEELYIKKGRFAIQSPAVKYRGIFLNDEAPALSGWAAKTFGGFNHQFYEKVFELILRLKGNYLWPAMWGSAFNDDDKLNPMVADDYGIVTGTSHHEPLTRAHDEWRRYGTGPWDYRKNAGTLRNFWKTGLGRVKDKEIVVTLGMRGDGDEPMTEGTATALLEQIVSDQRQIIEEVTEKPADQTPQVWALYKEVLDYYDNGMRVPDDVILLLCDDNWGNQRRLPRLDEIPRKGGYGIYYHFDYVGGPRNYKWLNTNPIQKIWEQMNLAYQYGANELWIVNVGDLKPMEFPISFFLDFAWNPAALPAEGLKAYTEKWASRQFGDTYAPEAAYLIDQYSKYAGRVKPELLDADTYSLVNGDEWHKVVEDYRLLLSRAQQLNMQLAEDIQDAFYQLVLHPIEAMCNLYELYEAHAKNKLYTQQGRNTANFYADEVVRLFDRDAEITDYYNNQLAGGKWMHMMDQTHIGYTYWQQPPTNVMPAVRKITVPKTGQLAVAIEGDTAMWTGKTTVDAAFPKFNNLSRATHYFELFNTGAGERAYRLNVPEYVQVSSSSGKVSDQVRIEVSIDWASAPKMLSVANIEITGDKTSSITLPIHIDNRPLPVAISNVFVEKNGYISMEAPHYSSAFHNAPLFWKTLENYGKTTGGVTIYPAAIDDQTVDGHTPHLAYDVVITEAGTFELHTFVSPTLDFRNSGGLRFGVSVNDSDPVIVNMRNETVDDASWGKSVAESIRILKTPLSFQRGKNTIKFWLVSPGVVLQKLVLDTGGMKDSFLGPEETFSVGKRITTQ